MTDAEFFSQGVVLFLVLFTMMVGLIFTIVPPLPGTVIMWAAAIVYGLLLGWEKLGWGTFGVLTFLMILGIVADFLGGQFGAKIGGASCLALVVGTILGLVVGLGASLFGTPLLGCVAGMAGTLGGILLVERHRTRNWQNALNATKGFLVGNIAGIMVRATTGCFMFAVFLARIYFWR